MQFGLVGSEGSGVIVLWECFAQGVQVLNGGATSSPGEETGEAEALLVHSDALELVVLTETLVDIVFLCLGSLKDILESISGGNVESLRSVTEV